MLVHFHKQTQRFYRDYTWKAKTIRWFWTTIKNRHKTPKKFVSSTTEVMPLIAPYWPCCRLLGVSSEAGFAEEWQHLKTTLLLFSKLSRLHVLWHMSGHKWDLHKRCSQLDSRHDSQKRWMLENVVGWCPLVCGHLKRCSIII